MSGKLQDTSETLWKKNQRNPFFKSDHIFKISTRSYMFRRLRGASFRVPKMILPKLCLLLHKPNMWTSTDSTRRYPLPTFTYSAYDVKYTQFRQDRFGIPEDGALEAPKLEGTSWHFKYIVYFEKCISLVFFHHTLKMHGPSCKKPLQWYVDSCFI
jgi:hypothetical protein